jgi:hypothetical protein
MGRDPLTKEKFYAIYNDFNLTVFDGLSSDNKIERNFEHYQSINKRA